MTTHTCTTSETAAYAKEPPSPTTRLPPSPPPERVRNSPKYEGFCHLTKRSSSLSNQCEDEPSFSVDVKYLGRIEAVRVEHSIRKHDHRYYVIHVYLKSTRIPIYRRDPSYAIEKPYVAFFTLRDTVIQSCEDYATHCEGCLTRVTILREHNENAVDVRRLLRSQQRKERRFEKFIHCLLGVCACVDGVEVELCVGCAATARTLVAFLKRQYQPSTGII